LDLQSKLNITSKVKKSLEQDLVQLKKTLYDTKNQYREELEGLTSQNQLLEKNLKRIEREMPKIKRENHELVKKVRDLECANVELEQ
jgi:predicted  nucleic acid-binding Zn-ribbon protein